MTHLPGLDTCSRVTALAVTRQPFPGLEPAGLQRRMTPRVLQAPKPQTWPRPSQWGWRAAYLLPKNSLPPISLSSILYMTSISVLVNYRSCLYL